MSPKYLLVLPTECKASSEVLAELAGRADLECRWRSYGFALLANRACRIVPIGDRGFIVGSLFPRHGPASPTATLSEAEVAAVTATNGLALLSRFWGGYVALVLDEDRGARVMRDPSGLCACYFAQAGGQHLFASDAELLATAGVPVGADVEEVGRQLFRAFVPVDVTALHGVRELLPGFSVELGSAATQASCWSPWAHVADRGLSTEEAAEHLARVVQHSLHAWASAHGRILLSVSGGLDSSILAACLARVRADVVCLTMYADDPAGDERPFARALCKHLDLPLVERPYRMEDIDIAQPLAPRLPRPRDRTQANAYENVHLQAAEEVGAAAFMTGNGGDNVFGYSQSAAPTADRWLAEGFGSIDALRSLLDVCRQTGCSLFDALAQAWGLARRSPVYQVRPNPMLLAPDFAASLGPADLRHPWLEAPPGSLPGKAAHIAAALRVQPNLEAHRGAKLPFITPLMSQPILETCFAIPSWEWRTGGRDRALARLAFAGALPAEVLSRRVKGTPSRFAARLLEHFQAPIRDRLLGGRLAAHGVLDVETVARLLRSAAQVPDLERVRLLEMVNAEAWLDHWATRTMESGR